MVDHRRARATSQRDISSSTSPQRGAGADAEATAREQRPGDDDAAHRRRMGRGRGRATRVDTLHAGRAVHVPLAGRGSCATSRIPASRISSSTASASTCFAADDGMRRGAGGRFEAGEMVDVLASRFESVFAPGPLSRRRGDRRARASGTHHATAGSEGPQFVVVGPHATGGLVDLPARHRGRARAVPARVLSAVDRPATLQPVGMRIVGRRRWPTTRAASSRSTWTHGGARVQAEVLRLGAGLRLAADAAADALRRALRRLHGVRSGSAATSSTTRSSCSWGSCSTRSAPIDHRRGHVGPCSTREPRPQDPVPAPRDPASRSC